MTKQIFAIQMLYLYEYLSIPPDQGRNRKYWDLMGHLTDEQFSNAVKNVIKEFVPTSTVPFPLWSHISCGTVVRVQMTACALWGCSKSRFNG